MKHAAPAALGSLEPPLSVRRFVQFPAAVQAMARHEAALCKVASRRRSSGLTVTDQDQPEEAFCLIPAHRLLPPLAIVGGMGPLAGADAFRRACARFRDTRAVALFQACSLPDRSAIILKGGTSDAAGRGFALLLADAVRFAVGLVGPSDQPVRCILACNSAHHFLRLLQHDLRQNSSQTPCDVRMVSLVQSSLEALEFQSCRKVLLLATEGSRAARLFSAPFRDAGIIFEEPSPSLGRLLMRAIFEGMKSLDKRRAVALGNAFFENVLHITADYDCVLAGCTEIALTIDLLKLRGNRAVAAFLSRMTIIDPLEEALRRA